MHLMPRRIEDPPLIPEVATQQSNVRRAKQELGQANNSKQCRHPAQRSSTIRQRTPERDALADATMRMPLVAADDSPETAETEISAMMMIMMGVVKQKNFSNDSKVGVGDEEKAL